MASGHRDDGQLRPNLAEHLGRKVGRERYSATGSYYGGEMSREGIGVHRDDEVNEMKELMSDYPGASTPGSYEKIVDKRGNSTYFRND